MEWHFPEDASALVAALTTNGREGAIWWHRGSWWATLPGIGKPTKHKTLGKAYEALEARCRP